LRRILEEGHAIGNRSYSHDYAIYRDVAAFASDLKRAEEVIQAVTGIRSEMI
jgi:peptidoglycan/xylan/chitin deacetylase (PgdA/CDA1 family)